MIGERVVSALQIYCGKEISIAFCPYKFSMFDCMESVYLAAKDAGLITSIIPLDYKTVPDNQWHNERKYFPYPTDDLDMLRVAKWDVIVIHYPYNARNNVTQLPEHEWVENLKHYGKVCYIPYHGNIAGPQWGRFYTTPGATDSDFVVLGSQLDYDIFMLNAKGFQGKVILPGGSPKEDAAIIHGKDDIPAEWRDHKQPYTVVIGTLHTFTHDPSERMQKHGSIIERELAQDHTVIYRPHPLVYPAIQAMRPEALRQYDDFLDELQSMGVIIDAQPNLHRTLSAADYVYMDPSSVNKTYAAYNRPFEVIE